MNIFKSEEEENVKQLIVVYRRYVLNLVLRVLDRVLFKLEELFKVEFFGELGVDYGGLKREFLRYDKVYQGFVLKVLYIVKFFSMNINFLMQ